MIVAVAGCSEAGQPGGWFAPQGERWTILCLELQGPDCQVTAGEIADVLRRTKGIDPKEVRVAAERGTARIHYGTYYRQVDPTTQKRSIPERMRADLLLLKELADAEGVHYFLHARKVPFPDRDVGEPEWDLRRAEGLYTLQVAVYFNTTEMQSRKLAAVEKARQLRNKGLEAYYYHGQAQSIVTVGLFGEDAVVAPVDRVHRGKVRVEPGQVVERYSDEVLALQKKPECAYNLTNDAIWYNIDRHGNRVPVRSMLVRIPAEEARP
jgi:hypothetical protein